MTNSSFLEPELQLPLQLYHVWMDKYFTQLVDQGYSKA